MCVSKSIFISCNIWLRTNPFGVLWQWYLCCYGAWRNDEERRRKTRPRHFLCTKDSLPRIICQKTFKGEVWSTYFSVNQHPQNLEIDIGLLDVQVEDKNQSETKLLLVFCAFVDPISFRDTKIGSIIIRVNFNVPYKFPRQVGYFWIYLVFLRSNLLWPESRSSDCFRKCVICFLF